ncbi:MAG: AI-2E family transporter [Clostridia bacterium]|nr:AI-2E family transporter [Clostridia bacterium]
MESLDQQNKKKLIRLAVIYAVVVLAILLIANRAPIHGWLARIYKVIRPVFIGLVLAYFCNPILRFLEQKLLRRLRPYGLRRVLSLVLTYVFLFALLAALIALLVPQLMKNLANLVFNYDIYIAATVVEINSLFEKINTIVEKLTGIPSLIEEWDYVLIKEKVLNLIGPDSSLMEYIRTIDTNSILGFLSSLFGTFKDYLFGLIVSIYFLASKELRYAQVTKLRTALFKNRTNEQISNFIHTANRSFGRFLTGRLLDSFLIFLVLYIVFSILKFPYAVLLALIIGLFNIIPIIGPYLGAIPVFFWLLVISPSKLLPFLIVLIIVQQIDANIISPNIVGSNTGVSAFCVVIAISTMGALWGIPGMILGIPLFATILEITKMVEVDRLQKKGLPSSIRNYYPADSLLDPERDSLLPAEYRRMKFEERILKIKLKAEEGLPLNIFEKARLGFYRFGCKIRLFGTISDNSLVHVSAENTAREIRREFRSRQSDGIPPFDPEQKGS